MWIISVKNGTISPEESQRLQEALNLLEVADRDNCQKAFDDFVYEVGRVCWSIMDRHPDVVISAPPWFDGIKEAIGYMGIDIR